MGLFDAFLRLNGAPTGGLYDMLANAQFHLAEAGAPSQSTLPGSQMSSLPAGNLPQPAAAPMAPQSGMIGAMAQVPTTLPGNGFAAQPIQAAPAAPMAALQDDRLGMALRGLVDGLQTGGLLSGINGLITGVSPLQQREQALQARGMDPTFARIVARDPEAMRAIALQSFKQTRALSPAEKQSLGLPGHLPWFMGADGKPALPEGIAQAMPTEIKDASGNPFAWDKSTNTAKPIGGMGPAQPKFDDVSGLRKEVGGLPEVKRYSEAIVPFRSMVQSATKNTAAADLDFVYGIAKIFDPDSVVREGEMKLVGQAQSLPEEIKGYIKRVAMGEGRLTPEARDRILQVAQTRINEIRGSYDTRINPYRAIAERNRINVDDILPVLPTVPEWKMPAASLSLPEPPPVGGVLQFNPKTRRMEPVK